ncbi:MAG: hypothetical protein IPH13_06080 [Planctomycetes bacterium]|nr:hypothetical protein [Planctomycetota bacterium]MCC7169046.1 hypothetical protein [Planctomycetota bacterium]
MWNGKLVVGGAFTHASGRPASHVAIWNGAAWSPLGSGTVGGVYPYVLALANYCRDFFAGGLFKSIGGVSAEGIARWNGTEWTPMSIGVFNGGSTSGVYTPSPYGSSLAAGGIFDSAGGVSAGDVAIWNQPYFDHGVGCAGIAGVPELSGVGIPEANSIAGLHVAHGRPNRAGLLFLGSQMRAQFFGLDANAANGQFAASSELLLVVQ